MCIALMSARTFPYRLITLQFVSCVYVIHYIYVLYDLIEHVQCIRVYMIGWLAIVSSVMEFCIIHVCIIYIPVHS